MRRLVHELGASILAPKKDATAVGSHNTVPCFFSHLVHHAVVLSASYSGVVDHTMSFKSSISRFQISEL